MRSSETYRGSRRNEARKRKLFWRGLDMIVLTTGERRITYPFAKNGKVIKEVARGQ